MMRVESDIHGLAAVGLEPLVSGVLRGANQANRMRWSGTTE